MKHQFDSIIVGGGFFGAYFAHRLALKGERVLLLEAERELLARASLVNQARIHRGYHYPRSVLTGFRSAVNFTRFNTDFRGCVNDTDPSYYAIAKKGSNVTASQFRRFCETIGAPLRPAPSPVTRLFNDELIDAVFTVEEYVFDAIRLREEMARRLDESGVQIALSSRVEKIRSTVAGPLVELSEGAEFDTPEVVGTKVFVCCYATLAVLLDRSELTAPSLRYELAEMALLRLPEELSAVSITVMCGPFFSTMPYPSRGLHTLSHVRYTPHVGWDDSQFLGGVDEVLAQRGRSRYPEMVRDASRYLPAIAQGEYVDSLWEIKAILPRSEMNDSRPILMTQVPEDPRIICVLGGKIDNIYDVWDLYDAKILRTA